MTATPRMLTETPRGDDAHERVLEDALGQLRLDGAIFFRSEFTEGWSYESPLPRDFANTFRPGSERLITFHIVAAGECWISLGDGERHWASAGDVIVMPYGDQHRLGGTEPATCVPIAQLIPAPPWDALPVLRYGDGGARCDIVCGYLYSRDPLFDRAWVPCRPSSSSGRRRGPRPTGSGRASTTRSP
jgi:hypothetical protein